MLSLASGRRYSDAQLRAVATLWWPPMAARDARMLQVDMRVYPVACKAAARRLRGVAGRNFGLFSADDFLLNAPTVRWGDYEGRGRSLAAVRSVRTVEAA
jgi:hypothetical protein